jgi:hypothetical protein
VKVDERNPALNNYQPALPSERPTFRVGWDAGEPRGLTLEDAIAYLQRISEASPWYRRWTQR